MTLIGYLGLFGLLLLWFGWLEPISGLPVSVVVVLLVGPLLFPLRGLLHGRFYTHAWASFLALFYFSAGVFSLAGVMRRPWLAWLEIAFSLLWFLGAILYVRIGARERRQLGKATAAGLVTNAARPTEDTSRRRLEKKS